MEDSKTEKFKMDPQDLLYYVVKAIEKMGYKYTISTEGFPGAGLLRIVRIKDMDVKFIIYGFGGDTWLEMGPASKYKELISKFIFELVNILPEKPWNRITRRFWIKRWPILKEIGD